MFRAALATGATVALLLIAAPTASATPSAINYNSTSCPKSLTDGENDGCVTYLQERLNTLGYGLSVDGDFGAHTLAAVESYQTTMHGFITNVSVDGQVGPITKGTLDYLIGNLSTTQYGGGGSCKATLNVDGAADTASVTITASGLPSGYYCSGVLFAANNSTPDVDYNVSSVHEQYGTSSVTTYEYSASGRGLFAGVSMHYANGTDTAWSNSEDF
ncbi:peptidoglycan-binding domain-containing protein [Streptacidiphilus cavernicola]|uniref:Peptidoglycan-binding protein n=1 Tax=Streptacidiphilus cavernicola TaxID=3342716 RepID=A0ABV6VWF2_9ACTN